AALGRAFATWGERIGERLKLQRIASRVASRWTGGALTRSFATWGALRERKRAQARKMQGSLMGRQRGMLVGFLDAWGVLSERARRGREAFGRRRRGVQAVVVFGWRGVACGAKRLRVVGRRVVVGTVQ
ncbi:hypothetical protein T484DRAFT_1863476, partial [Baffinella frigidus]